MIIMILMTLVETWHQVRTLPFIFTVSDSDLQTSWIEKEKSIDEINY